MRRVSPVFTYAIPLSTPGSYTVTLKFNEPSKTAAGQRVFDVSLEGSLVLDDFDIYAVNNTRNTAVDRSFLVSVTDGALNVTFGRVTDYPIISAIEVLWAGSSPATPSVTYTYRGDGLRNSKTVTSTITYTWDINSGLPVVLQDGSQTYVYGLGGLISQTDGSGTQSYFLGNGLGSTEKLTDGSGNVVATYKYDIFGAVRASTGSGSAEYRFTGQQDDATLGYTYLRARYYDQTTGRFLSKDPFPGLLTNPASQHYYTYVQNNPVNLTDPSGEIAPLVVVAALWMAYEIGSSAYDAYTTGQTLLDPCASIEEKAFTSGLFVVGLVAPGGGYTAFGKAGIRTTEHFLKRLGTRASRGVTERNALDAYNKGRLFFNPATRRFIRHDSKTKVSVVVDQPSGGKAISVFEGNPSPDWTSVPWRPGS